MLSKHSRCNAIIGLLTKDALKLDRFVLVMQQALKSGKKLVLVHDPMSCSFPGPNEQPPDIAVAFSTIAITLVEDYAQSCWQRIVNMIKVILHIIFIKLIC